MNRHVNFRTLWLVSEFQQKAKKQTFNRKRTILFGPNGTGKSRITKNLFWTLGCSPEKHIGGGWDPNTIGALEFEYGGDTYLVVRQNKLLGLFDANRNLLKFADTMGNWDRIMADLFGYQLLLQRPGANARHSRAGIDYLTLPFYIDQDGSWGPKWSTFTTLSQFKNWQKTVFESFIGLRPNAYFFAHQLWQEASTQLRDRQSNMDTQRMAFQRVRDILPRNVPVLDTGKFESELAFLAQKAQQLQQEQAEIRAKLVVAVNLREKLNSELQLAVSAHRSLTDDLSFLSEQSDAGVECPTCGTLHTSSFHARLQLTQDAQSLSLLINELRHEKGKALARHSTLLSKLNGINEQIRALNSDMQEQQTNLKAEDLLLAAHSVRTLDNAFESVTADLAEEINSLAAKEDKLKADYKKFEDRVRQKEVNKYFSDSVTSFSVRLNIPVEEQIGKAKPGHRGQVGGSSGPRSLLAVHLAMLRSNAEYGDTPFFPFVVDTPQQSGQDPVNLASMIQILGRSVGENHQVILAVEMLPEGVDTAEFEIVDLKVKRGLLNENDFKAAAFLAQPLRAMKDAVAAHKATIVAD